MGARFLVITCASYTDESGATQPPALSAEDLIAIADNTYVDEAPDTSWIGTR